MGLPSRRVLAPVLSTFVYLLFAYVVVPAVASAAAGPHARRARALLIDGTPAASPSATRKLAAQPDCNSCPLTRQPVCSETGLEFQNDCLARCQGIIASRELCRLGFVFTAAVDAQRSQQSEVGAVNPAQDADGSVHKTSMRRFRGEGFVMVAARPPAEFASAAHAAGGNRRSMQDGSPSNPIPAPLLQVSPGLANAPAPADPAEITEYRITPDGQVFARKLTSNEMANYRAQRGRASAGSDFSRGSGPDVLPSTAAAIASERRELPSSAPSPKLSEQRESPSPAPSPRPSEKREVPSPAPSPRTSDGRETPSPAPSERRELEDVATVAAQHAVPRHEDGEEELEDQDEEYSTDVNDVYIEDDSYGDGEIEVRQKAVHDASGVDAKTLGLQERRRRLSYIIPSRDDRLEETTDVYPGRASGRFNYRNPRDGLMYFCSGTLISNNAVLLAAHCVVDVTRSPLVWMDTFSFVPGARSSVTPYGTATIKFVQYTSLYTNTTPGNDLAVAILNTQPGDLTGWLGYGYDCLAQSYQVNTTGFPSDKKSGTRWRANCTTAAVNPCNLNATAGLAPMQCDIVGGQSGSAIFSSSTTTGPRARFVVAYEAKNATAQWNGAAVINQNTFPFIDNLVKTYKVNSPPPPPPRPPPPPSSTKGRRLLRQSLRKLLRRQ